MLRLHKNLWILIAGIMLCLTFIISYDSRSVPEWKIRVIDESGNPISKRVVTQRWMDSSLERGYEHQENLHSDQDGYVTFPERTVNASLFKRLCGVGIRTLGILNPHASQGAYAFVTTPRDGFLMYREGGNLESEIVVKE